VSYFTDHSGSLPATARQVMRDPERRVEDELSEGQVLAVVSECKRALQARRYVGDRELAAFLDEFVGAL